MTPAELADRIRRSSAKKASALMWENQVVIIAALRACETARLALLSIKTQNPHAVLPDGTVIEGQRASAFIARSALAELEKVMKP